MGLVNLLPEGTWQALLRKGRVRQYSRGEVLMRQGDEGSYVLLLTSGRVKVHRVEADGREVLLAARGPGEALGDISVWGDSRRSATVTALDPCIAYILSAERFRRTVNELEATDVLLCHVMTRLREGEDIRAELVGPSARQRVARVLVRFALSTSPDPEASFQLNDGLSQEELARAAGVSRSAFAAELAEFRRQGLVSSTRHRKEIVLRDLAGLRAVAGV